jgi:ATP-dependent protease HslVU (ClpYQ) peptidase subunit
MTCIIGIVDKKRVIIGGDSCASGDCREIIRKDVKVFRNGDFIFGCTSSYRMIQLLMYSFIPPKVNTKNIHRYMCTDFIEELRKCFKKGGYIKKFEEGDEKGGTFLVGYKNRLFRVEDDLQVAEASCGFNAAGIGEGIALGALFALKRDTFIRGENLIKHSLSAVSELSEGVRPPFIILSTY